MAEKTSNLMSTQTTLSAYSQWLDQQGIILGPDDDDPRRAGDMRSHDDLAVEFVALWESNESRATLAGRAFGKFLDAVQAAAETLKK